MLTLPNVACPELTSRESKNTPPVATILVPLYVNPALSTNSPPAPAYTIRVGVRSDTFKLSTSA